MSDRNPHPEIDLVDIENLIERLRESDDDDAPQLDYVADALEGALARWDRANRRADVNGQRAAKHESYIAQLEAKLDNAGRTIAKAELDKTTQDLIAARAERDDALLERNDLKRRLGEIKRPSDADAPRHHDADEVRLVAWDLRHAADATTGVVVQQRYRHAADLLDGLMDRQVYDLAMRADLETQLNDCEARVADQAHTLAILEKLAAPMLTMPHRAHEHIHTDVHPPEAGDESETEYDWSPSLDVGDLSLIRVALEQRAESLAKHGSRTSVRAAEVCYRLAERVDAAYEAATAAEEKEDRT